VNSSSKSFGIGRERPTSVSFADIEAAARKLMAAGDYPSVATVRKELKRGSTTTIADAMRRFWKDQAALNAGNPVALTRLPPEFADAAVALWEQALRLSLQTAQQDDSAGRAKLEELKRDTESRARSMELREKEWDIAARVRERALSETREQVNVLLKELANATAELRANKVRIAGLESQIEDHRRQLSTVIARAVSRNRLLTSKKTKAPAKPKRRQSVRKTVVSKRARRRRKR
jgi:Plasmid replication region DNA-binding N-term